MRRALRIIAAATICTFSGTRSWAGPTVDAAVGVGLTAESLCACGTTVAEVEGVLANLRQAASERAAVSSAQATVGEAARSLALIESQLAADPLNTSLPG